MKKLILLLLLLCAQMVSAQENSDEAIRKTQELLKNQAERNKVIGETSAATTADGKVKGLAGTAADEQAIYELAAEVLGNMKGKTPEQMSKVVGDADSNPAGFAETWTPEQKKKLKEISDRIPAGRASTP